VNSEFAVVCSSLIAIISDPRDTFFRDRSDPEGRRYRTKKAKQKKEKKEKETMIEDHKSD